MEFRFDTMGEWEIQKAMCICMVAKKKLNWNLSAYGECAVNPNSGYTYLWLEDYYVSLYIPISFDGEMEDNIWVLYTDTMNGDEYEMLLSEFESMNDIGVWVDGCMDIDEE
jgi:hypothetical protein